MNFKARLCGLLGMIFLAGLVLRPARGAVMINEIMYHPASTNLLEEWFELYNSGPTNVNLSGWRISKGLDFTFPANTTLAAGEYLVLAADTAVFSAHYPGVANVVPASVGPLSGHTITLEDSASNNVSSVTYYNEGDWAARILTTNGFASYGFFGWRWYAAHDGLGSSLELVNPSQPISYAQNWGSSTNLGGTPGRANSLVSTNVAPFISGVSHRPIVPQPADSVTITARVLDEHTNGVAVTLFYRNATTANPPAFSSTAMFDDGGHGDGLAADGIYGAILPPQPHATVMEFYLQATDLEGHARIYPNVVPPTNSQRTANLLYQVDSGTYGGVQPLYRLVMTEIERNTLYLNGRQCTNSDSDAEMNATFITTDGVVAEGSTIQLRYNLGVRNRGHGSRQSNPNNYHLNIPSDRAWKKQAGINLNSQYAHSQVLASAVFNRLEVPMADSRAVQVRVNSTNLMVTVGNNSFGSYAADEQYNNDFVSRAFPLDSGGNSYRGIRQAALCDPTYANNVADLAWHGVNSSQAVYTNSYFKQNHFTEDDWTDLIGLIGVLNLTNGTTAATYVSDIQRVLNVEQWMKYMAINTLIDNDETCLANGAGDDYALYRGALDTRFQALPYDLDTVMGRGLTNSPPGNGIWRMTNVPAMNRFMKTPEFAPVYFRALKSLADTAFSPAQMNPLLDQLLKDYIPDLNLSNFRAFNAAQVSAVLAQIPFTLTVSHSLAVSNGYPRATNATTALRGVGNAVDTRAIVVAGITSSWTAWQATWTNNAVPLTPGINRILIQALGTNGLEIARTNFDIWYDDGTVQTAGGTIASDTVWTAAGGPYSITSSLTVSSGATLTIQPGTTVYLASGVNFVVANGGRLLAEGTAAAPIRFTTAPGSGVSWGGMTLNGAVGSPETRIAYAFFEGNSATCIEVAGGTLFLDHTTFGTTTHQYLALDGSSFLVSSCIFPTSTAGFELVHGTGGIKSGGRGIVRDCFFGTTSGNNDIMDYTGGNRDQGQPIIQYYNNVFTGATDDMLDLDGTDAWIEGNIFLHAHQGPSHPALGTSSAISGGSSGSDTSQITIIGNLFYDCDNIALAKEGNFYTLLNNTVVHQSHQGSSDTDGAIVALADEGAAEALGMYLEGNVVYDAEKLVRNMTNAIVTFSNNLMPYTWSGPGGGNSTNNPLLKYVPQLSETFFTNWQDAQVMRDWFSLRSGSPAIGAGPNQRDQGGVIPLGASISGEPVGTNNQTTATLVPGIVRTGNGIPVSGFPNGSGYTHYKWRLDSGAWSAETPIASPINLSSLPNGPHHVDLSGKRDSGFYQDDAAFGADALVTTSRTWTVDTTYVPPTKPRVRINEVLAKNSTTLTNLGTTPDLIELYNYGPSTVDLAGMGLTDGTNLPYKFTFPAGTTLASGNFMILFADSATGGPYLHTGFSLKQTGDDVSLFDKPASGGAVIDAVVFGQQIPDASIGRLTDGSWGICKPTFGSANIAQLTGDPRLLKINEWLADAQFVASSDFIELYNLDALPVALGGLFLSDAAGAPARNMIAPLSFIAAKGFTTFIADGDAGQGPDHLNFKLSPDVGLILLSATDLTTIDAISYGPQRTDVSQGRSPNGGDIIVSFPVPTPGSGNPSAPGNNPCTVTNITINLMGLTQQTWKYNQSNNLNGINWMVTNYNDSAWQGPGQALLAFENNSLIVPLIHTTLLDPKNVKSPPDSAYYFRTSFVLNTNLAGFTVTANVRVDDGAVIYINGVEIPTRIRMDPGTVTFTNLANSKPPFASGDAEGNDVFTIPNSYFVQGINYVAVEVHQVDLISTDIVWGIALDAIKSITNCAGGNLMPIVLNEVLASNATITNSDGTTPDWIELYNPSTNTVDLADTSLSNDPSTPRKFVFAPGTFLAPGGFKVVDCDGNKAASSTNTGFSLSANGGAIYFFDRVASGGGLIDALSFGLQTPDYSLGRVPDGVGLWALNLPTRAAVNGAAGLASISSLKVNEWMADPASGSDWFEIYNTNTQPVPIGGLYLTDDLNNHSQSAIAPLSFIGTGANGFLQFFADSGDGYNHVTFSLKKSGEAVGIFSPSGVMLDGISFGAQLTGVSQGRLPDGSANIVSFATTASPGESNFLPITAPVINEVLSHTDPPLEDAIELFNPTGLPMGIGGWYLSNSKDNFKKFRIPDGTFIGPNGFAVFYEYQFNSTNGVPFTFNSAEGDSAILSYADPAGNLTGYRAEVKFGAAENGVSFGRYQTSVGVDFTALHGHSFGADHPATLAQFRTGTGLVNLYPKVGPVVISEIMYFSTTNGVENPNEEFLELANITAIDVPLYDLNYPTNAWLLRDAVDFQFPTNLTLPANGRLLVVGFSPTDTNALAAFRAKFNVPANVPIYGPWTGRLSNTDDSVELIKPDAVQLPPHPDAGLVPQILVDKVHYQNAAPWPAGATTGSNSLQRVILEAYGNDPINWLAAGPTAGRTNNTSLADTDNDGMADSWEMAWFGTLARDGTGDYDGDGQTDLQEYLAGTSPVDPDSNLKIDSIEVLGGSTAIHFTAAAGKTYSLLYRNTAATGTWSKLADVSAQPGTVTLTITDPTPNATTRFYRLVTPKLP